MGRMIEGVVNQVGQVRSLYRYPVKSLVGEGLDHATVDPRGLRGDRLWSVRDLDGKLGSGKSTRRFRRMPGLLHLAATYDGDVPVIRFRDGTTVRGPGPEADAALSRQVGRSVKLAREGDVSHFDDGPVHVVTTATLDELERRHGRPVDVRRLRPNLVVDTGDLSGFTEDGWVGAQLALGPDVVLAITAPMPRCVMVDLPQRGLRADRGLLKTATTANAARVGVVADVLRPGEVHVGDDVHLGW